MSESPEAPNPDETSEPNDPLALQPMLDLGFSLRKQLEASLDKQWSCLQRAYVLAGMMRSEREEEADMRLYTLDSMGNAVIALSIGPMVESYVTMHDVLTAHGHTADKSKFNFRNDAYVWAVPERYAEQKDSGIDFKVIFGDSYEPEPPDPKARRSRAIVLETQGCSFLVVLNYAYGRWVRVDVRQFWPDVRTSLADSDDWLLHLNDIRNRTDLTVVDLVRYSTRAAAYSDDFGAETASPKIERPSLATMLDGSLIAVEESGGPALRYGDARDSGYVVSVKLDRDRPESDDMEHTRISPIVFVMHNLESAKFMLSEEYPAGPSAAGTDVTSGNDPSVI